MIKKIGSIGLMLALFFNYAAEAQKNQVFSSVEISDFGKRAKPGQSLFKRPYQR